MPAFLEKKLKKEYPGNPGAVYGTMNKLGLMHGNKETKKGEAVEKKHEMSKKMMKRNRDPNDSDKLRKFSRINPNTDKPLFHMPEGRYVKKGDRYVKTNEKLQSVIHD